MSRRAKGVMCLEITEQQKQMVSAIRDFVNRDVLPVAANYDHADEYPSALVETMKGLGLFGALVPKEYGGLGLDNVTFSMIIEELCKGWMSLSGPLGSHSIMTHVISTFGTDEQKHRFLPSIATGERRGGVCLTEPEGGSDLQSIRTVAVKDGDEYVINGAKMFVTNGTNGNTYALLTKTDTGANPPYKGMSCFIIEKGGQGFFVGKQIKKLGYRGVDTAEFVFQDFRVPATNLVGGIEGRGFTHIMSGLEGGRINVASRALGVAQAAFEAAIRYAQNRRTFGKPISQHQAIQLKLADMATKIEAARLLTLSAATKKDRGERCDLEAGMAKLFASETCHEVTMEAMRIHGGYGYTEEFPIERYYRDAPLMMIGEGTNEIQRLVIANNLLKKYQV